MASGEKKRAGRLKLQELLYCVYALNNASHSHKYSKINFIKTKKKQNNYPLYTPEIESVDFRSPVYLLASILMSFSLPPVSQEK